MSATVPTVDWVAVAATVVVAVVLIAVVVASAGTLAPALGIGLMGLGMSYGAAMTTGAVIAAVVAGTAATTIGITTISDVSEMVGGRNVVRDDMLGGNQGLYDGIKFASAMAALGMGEVAMANPGLAAGSKPASSGGAMGATPKPASSGGTAGTSAGVKPTGSGSGAATKSSGVAGNGNSVPVANIGSTGRTEPKNLFEQMSMREVQSNPLANSKNLSAEGLILNDTRWSASDGWVKMQVVKE